MEGSPILGSSREGRLLNEVIALHGPPAFVRRAQNVELAWERVLERCRRQRVDWLNMTSIHLAMLHGLAGSWTALRALVADDGQLMILTDLHNALRPSLRVPVTATTSARALRKALGEIIESLETFNVRWRLYLDSVDLADVNRLREDYNRYYLLEKECMVRSAAIARRGFVRLAPATVADVEAEFPLLAVPRRAKP